MNEQWWWVIAGAVAGTLARIGQWRKPDDSVDWWKAVGECMSIPAVAFIVAGGVQYFAPDLDTKIITGISCLAAVVGMATIEALAIRFFNKKIDG